MKKVLVFGASGDLGRYLVEYLNLHGKNQFSVITSGSRATSYYSDMGIDYYRVDISNADDFKVLPTNIDIVIDLAGYMPAKMKGYIPEKYFSVNTVGTLNILEFCINTGVKKIIFSTSFGDILGNLKKDIVLKWNSPIDFSYTTDHTAYVISKIAACQLIENYHQQYGIDEIIFRLPTVYMWAESPYYYVNGEIKKLGYRLLIDKAIAGETIEVFGDASRVKDMVYVKDFCKMVYLSMIGSINKGIYNVGTGIGTSLLDIVKGMVEVFGTDGRKSKVILRPDMPDTPQYIMDISNAKNDLRYEPDYSYREMLIDMKQEMNKRVNGNYR